MIETKLLFSFSSAEKETSWQAIDDRVMGGVSQSALWCTKQDTAVFSGTVSLERNGGFASVRSETETQDLSMFTGIAVRVKGEGNRYKLRLRTDPSFNSINYEQAFETNGMWQDKYLPFDRFHPTRRGKVVDRTSAFDSSKICTFGLLISDKQVGPFRLEVEWIKAYKD